MPVAVSPCWHVDDELRSRPRFAHAVVTGPAVVCPSWRQSRRGLARSAQQADTPIVCELHTMGSDRHADKRAQHGPAKSTVRCLSSRRWRCFPLSNKQAPSFPPPPNSGPPATNTPTPSPARCGTRADIQHGRHTEHHYNSAERQRPRVGLWPSAGAAKQRPNRRQHLQRQPRGLGGQTSPTRSPPKCPLSMPLVGRRGILQRRPP